MISGVNSNPKIIIDQRLNLNKRSISTKNLKSKLKSGNLKLSSLQNKIPTYKLDGMNIITNRLNQKYRSYFEAIVKYANRVKHIYRDSVSKRVVRQSFTSLKKAITCYKEIENHLTNRSNHMIRQDSELRRSAQNLAVKNINRSRSSFEVSNGKVKYQNEDEVEPKLSFIIQPGKELFSQRRNSGLNSQNYQTLDHNLADISNSSPPTKQIHINSKYRRAFKRC